MSPPPPQTDLGRAASCASLVALALIVAATAGCDMSRRHRGSPAQAVLPDDGGPQPSEGAAMVVVLPHVKRRSELRWGVATKLPGHLGAPLITRKGKHPVVLVTVDDLLQWPERIAELAALPKMIAGLPTDIAPGSWIRVLVANRFEVVVRPRVDTYRDPDKLREWFDRLKLDELAKLAAPPPEPAREP